MRSRRCFGVRGRDSKLLGVAACMPPGAVKCALPWVTRPAVAPPPLFPRFHHRFHLLRSRRLTPPAAFSPPRKGVVLTSWRWLRVLLRAGAPEIFRSKDRFGPLPGARCEVMGEAVDGLHKACAPGPHWYVFTLGVAHGTQSRGVGTALLSVIANLAVADKCPVYLEAAGDNANYYRSRGFRVVKSATLRAPPSLPTGAVAKAAAAAEEQAEWQREGAELGGALRGHAMLLEGPVVLSKVARDMPVLSAIRKSRDQRR